MKIPLQWLMIGNSVEALLGSRCGTAAPGAMHPRVPRLNPLIGTGSEKKCINNLRPTKVVSRWSNVLAWTSPDLITCYSSLSLHITLNVSETAKMLEEPESQRTRNRNTQKIETWWTLLCSQISRDVTNFAKCTTENGMNQFCNSQWQSETKQDADRWLKQWLF